MKHLCPVCKITKLILFLKRFQVPVHQNLVVNSQESARKVTRGELDLVVGATRGAIQQSDHRRVESLQRPFNEKIQSLEETLKELRETHYPDGNT